MYPFNNAIHDQALQIEKEKQNKINNVNYIYLFNYTIHDQALQTISYLLHIKIQKVNV